MTTPQPNQLPEEVKRAIETAVLKMRETCTTYEEDISIVSGLLTPYLTPRQDNEPFTREPQPNDGLYRNAQALYGDDSRTSRPPAPVDAETVIKGETFSDSSQGNAMRKKFAESMDAEWAKRAVNEIAEYIDAPRKYFDKLLMSEKDTVEAIILRHAPADQLAAINVQLNWPLPDSPFNKFACTVADVGYADKILSVDCPEAIAQLAAAQSEVGGLTKDVAVANAYLKDALNEVRVAAGAPKMDDDQTKQRAPDYVATLRRERDELRAKADRVTLSVREIFDLAGMAGLKVEGAPTEDDDETEVTITPCPSSGVIDEEDDGKAKWEPRHYKHVAYFEEYPEEGVCPLGAALDSARATQGEGQSEDAKEGRK